MIICTYDANIWLHEGVPIWFHTYDLVFRHIISLICVSYIWSYIWLVYDLTTRNHICVTHMIIYVTHKWFEQNESYICHVYDHIRVQTYDAHIWSCSQIICLSPLWWRRTSTSRGCTVSIKFRKGDKHLCVQLLTRTSPSSMDVCTILDQIVYIHLRSVFLNDVILTLQYMWGIKLSCWTHPLLTWFTILY